MKYIQPILVVPGGEAPQADFDLVNRAGWLIQQWLETRYRADVMAYVLRPLRPPCNEPWSYFAPSGDPATDNRSWQQMGAWLMAQGIPEMLAKVYIPQPDPLVVTGMDQIFHLVFLQDFHDERDGHADEYYTWWGWGTIGGPGVSLKVAVVDYGLINNLADANLEGVEASGNYAMGELLHEYGHMLGWPHLNEPYPNLMSAHWQAWPAVNIPDEIISTNPPFVAMRWLALNPPFDHSVAMRWLDLHFKDLERAYPDEWLAIEGQHLIAHAPRLLDAVSAAKALGVDNPFIVGTRSTQDVDK